MNWIDLAVLAVWGTTALWGLQIGLIRMTVTLVVVGGGLAFSSRIVEPVGNILSLFIDSENVQTIVVLIVTMTVLLLAAVWASRFLSTIIRYLLPLALLFGLVNRGGGLAAGMLLGFVLLAVMLTGLQRFPVAGLEEDIDDSTLGTFVADNFDVVMRATKLIPGDWDNKLNGSNQSSHEIPFNLSPAWEHMQAFFDDGALPLKSHSGLSP